MSRIIVKNLNKRVTEDQLRQHFSQKGVVTDVKLVQNIQKGTFRHFAFVGFRDPQDGPEAQHYFNNTYIGTSKVFVEQAFAPREREGENSAVKIEDDVTRVFLRNLSYQVTQDEIRKICEPFGEITDLRFPTAEGRPKGFAIVSYANTQQAVSAITGLDRTVFQGRLLHALPGKAAPEDQTPFLQAQAQGPNLGSSFKTDQLGTLKKRGAESWNSLFINTDAIADHIAETSHKHKGDVAGRDTEDLAVKLSLEESKMIQVVKDWMTREGVNTDAFSEDRRDTVRSDTTILIKNFSSQVSQSQLHDLFGRYGTILKLIMSPTRTVAIVEFSDTNQAAYAFEKLSFYRIKKKPLYLEWAPINTFEKSGAPTPPVKEDTKEPETVEPPQDTENKTIFVKNLNFETTEDVLKRHMESVGDVASVKIISKNGQPMGFGFVEYMTARGAKKAMQNLNNVLLENHALKLAPSDSGATKKQQARQTPVKRERERSASPEQTTRLIVKNLPFEADRDELKTLFSEFGHVASVRLPKKPSGGHRGFAFVDFVSFEEANAAQEGLKHAHLYGRHLIIEPSKKVS